MFGRKDILEELEEVNEKLETLSARLEDVYQNIKTVKHMQTDRHTFDPYGVIERTIKSELAKYQLRIGPAENTLDSNE